MQVNDTQSYQKEVLSGTERQSYFMSTLTPLDNKITLKGFHKANKSWNLWSEKKQYNKSNLKLYYRIRERNLQWLTSLSMSLLDDKKNIRILKTDLWNEVKKDERYFLDALGTRVAIDISEKLCRSSKMKFDERISITQGTIECLPFRPDIFHLIWDISTIDHSEHPRSVLNEYYRVLKVGGVLLLIVENLLCFSFPITKIQSYLGFHVPFNGYLLSKVMKDCQLAGFEIVDHFKTNVHLPRFIVYPLEKKDLLEDINRGRNVLWDLCKKYSVILCRKI